MSPFKRHTRMPKRKSTPLVRCQYFRWRLRQRAGVYYADGRGNQPNLEKHSLGTRQREEAEVRLHELDLKMAVEHGLAPASSLRMQSGNSLPLEQGRQLYADHLARPAVAGGVQESTKQRYRAPLKKFLAFCEERAIRSWDAVNRGILERYATRLQDQNFSPKTIYNELTLIKQVVKWLSAEGHLVEREPIKMKMVRPHSQPA
jgi:Phage integrase, N-terminal SAM-like domain